MSMLFILLIFFIPFTLSYASKEITLSKEHKAKLEKIAQIIADDVSRRGIKTEEKKEFTKLKGKSAGF